MKKFVKMTILALSSALVFVACGAESPKEATQKFYTALKTGDVAEYQKYSTDSTQRLMGLTFTMGCFNKNLNDQKELSECMKTTFSGLKSFKITNVTESSKTSANVAVEETNNEGVVKSSNVDLEKINEQWKVNIKK